MLSEMETQKISKVEKIIIKHLSGNSQKCTIKKIFSNRQIIYILDLSKVPTREIRKI